MKTTVLMCLLSACLSFACSADPPPEACGPADQCVAQAPDRDKAIKHFESHVQYPASRQDILAACADTPEFTAAEKQWLSDHLPERTYASAGEVVSTLKL